MWEGTDLSIDNRNRIKKFIQEAFNWGGVISVYSNDNSAGNKEWRGELDFIYYY